MTEEKTETACNSPILDTICFAIGRCWGILNLTMWCLGITALVATCVGVFALIVKFAWNLG